MNYSKFLIAGWICLFLFSCNNPSGNEKKISVSIEPQKYFLEKIVGDKFQVVSAIPPGTDPETFDPTPQQMINLGKSLLYFKVGALPFESVLAGNMKENNPEVRIIDCSANIQMIGSECHHHEHSHGHSHGHDGNDPHIWSSPRTATQMAKNMLEAVKEADPANADYYTENYNNLLQEFQHTDSIIKSYLDSTSHTSFIIYHPALSYFANEYGLAQYSIEFEGKNPTPAQIKELVDLANRENIRVVFIQEEYDRKNAETIAKEIGAGIVQINLLSYNWSEEMIKIAKALSSKDE